MNQKIWEEALNNGFQGTYKFDEKLSAHTYYRIGGPASLVVTPVSTGDLGIIAQALKKDPQELFFLGLGSNLLVADAGFRGVVIKTQKLCMDWELVDETLSIGASLPIVTVLRRAAEQGIGGLEFWAGIPGSVGGTIFMNAGTTLGETKDHLTELKIFSFETGLESTLVAPFQYEYRKNLFLKKTDLVMSAKFKIKKEEPALVKSTIQSLLEKRKQAQPVDVPSCGSVFKNPRPESAWKVVEKLGLKGHRIGGAQISEKHSNFIINTGNAKAADVKALIDLVKSKALSELGIKMEEEVRYLGF